MDGGITDARRAADTSDDCVNTPRFGQPSSGESKWVNASWVLLIAIGIVAVVRNGLSTFAYFKGTIGVGYETAFGTTLLRPLPQLVLNMLVFAGMWIVLTLALRRLHKIPSGVFRVFCALIILASLGQLRAFERWGDDLAAALSCYDLVIEGPTTAADLDRVSDIAADWSARSSIRGESGQFIVRVPPVVEDRIGEVRTALEKAGFRIRTLR